MSTMRKKIASQKTQGVKSKSKIRISTIRKKTTPQETQG